MPKIKAFYLFKFLKPTERSDTTILGNLGILEQFRQFPDFSG
jgi:hypothetical protein